MPGAVMKRVAALLRDGEPMTITQISEALKCQNASAWYACKVHPLIYIDHWRLSHGAVTQWVAVYAIADPPEDTPRPTMRPKQYMESLR
jgi:hypothetical protein